MSQEVGSVERELAMAALDEHRRSGHLERAEHGRRCATASRAERLGDLDALFADLPEPHPVYPGRPAVPASPDGSDTGAEPRREAELPELVVPLGAMIGRNAGKIAPVVPIVIIVLEALIGFRFPIGFLLIPVSLAVVGWLGHRYGS